MPVLDYAGYCPICKQEVRFVANGDWYRDHLICSDCKSLPRHRSFYHILKILFPNYLELMIHESSPIDYIAKKMFHHCRGYTSSHYWPDVPLGSEKWGHFCQDLENLTFPDESFDLFITMDVMEHILDPSKAFREIARVLKPSGAHIFTVPIHQRDSSLTRAIREGQNIKYLFPAEYHGSPCGDGSLVTMEWGKDITEHIFQAAGLHTAVYNITNRNMGIIGAMTDVLVSFKQFPLGQEVASHKKYTPEYNIMELLKRGIRCYKENGPIYTMDHMFKYLKF